jgi:hypothetical protein
MTSNIYHACANNKAPNKSIPRVTLSQKKIMFD